MTDKLGNRISYEDIKQRVRTKTSIEFSAKAKQINLTDPEVRTYLSQVANVTFPPLLNKQEIFKILWSMDTSSDSLKWDYITLLTYLSDGKIIYSEIDEDNYLVTIKF